MTNKYTVSLLCRTCSRYNVGLSNQIQVNTKLSLLIIQNVQPNVLSVFVIEDLVSQKGQGRVKIQALFKCEYCVGYNINHKCLIYKTKGEQVCFTTDQTLKLIVDCCLLHDKFINVHKTKQH